MKGRDHVGDGHQREDNIKDAYMAIYTANYFAK